MNQVKKLIWSDNIMYLLCFAGGYAVGMYSQGMENISIVKWGAYIIMAFVLLSINLISSFKTYKQGKPAVSGSKGIITMAGVALFMVIAIIQYCAENYNGELKFPVTAFVIGTVVTAVVMAIYANLTKKFRTA